MMQESNLQNSTNDAGMSMEAKGRCGRAADEAGMSMKKQVLIRIMREYY
jgi:hypothetical protein